MVSAFLQDLTSENRLFERFPARFPVKFKYSVNEYGSDVFLRDASAQGLKIETRQKLFLHDSVSLQVEIPGTREPMELNGRVVWTKSQSPSMWEAGVEFHKINLMKIHRLFQFVNPG